MLVVRLALPLLLLLCLSPGSDAAIAGHRHVSGPPEYKALPAITSFCKERHAKDKVGVAYQKLLANPALAVLAAVDVGNKIEMSKAFLKQLNKVIEAIRQQRDPSEQQNMLARLDKDLNKFGFPQEVRKHQPSASEVAEKKKKAPYLNYKDFYGREPPKQVPDPMDFIVVVLRSMDGLDHADVSDIATAIALTRYGDESSPWDATYEKLRLDHNNQKHAFLKNPAYKTLKDHILGVMQGKPMKVNAMAAWPTKILFPLCDYQEYPKEYKDYYDICDAAGVIKWKP